MAISNPPLECADCDVYVSRYESATFNLARAHNALEIAEQIGDPESLQRLIDEEQIAADRRERARADLIKHCDLVHSVALRAGQHVF